MMPDVSSALPAALLKLLTLFLVAAEAFRVAVLAIVLTSGIGLITNAVAAR